MKSFFGSMQSKFKATYEGRFFSTILAEVIQSEPNALYAVFPDIAASVCRALAKGDATVVTEYPLGRSRRADLAVLLGGVPIALAEIKQTDIQGAGVAAQLRDYRAEVARAKGRVDFSLVSQFEPYEEHRKVIGSSWGRGHAEVIRFHDLARRLSDMSDTPAVELLLDYMREQGMTGYKPLEKLTLYHALAVLLTRLLPTKHAHGLGRLHSNEAIQDTAATLSVLLANIRHMEDWLRSANEAKFPHVFTSDFKVLPWYDKVSLEKHLKKGDDGYFALPTQHCNGGEVRISVQASIPAKTMKVAKGNGIALRYGYQLELDITKKTKIRQYVFATCWAQKKVFPKIEGADLIRYKAISLAASEAKIRKAMRETLGGLFADAAAAAASSKVSRFLEGIKLSGF